MTNTELKNKLELVITLLNQICDNLVMDDPKQNAQSTTIDRLKAGEELELSDEEIDEVLDYLEDHEDSYSIKIINNKVTLKL